MDMTTHQLDEASLVRLYQHTIERNIGIITAFRGRYTRNENIRRNTDLQHEIRTAGFGYYRMEGHYIEGYGSEASKDVNELSYLVIGDKNNDNGKLKGILKKLGAKYNQDSILYKAFDNKSAVLIGTQDKDEDGNPVEFPGNNNEIVAGEFKPMKVNQFYSKMRGRPFVFESYAVQMTWMEAYCKYLTNNASKGN